jgi:hypothetical protein
LVHGNTCAAYKSADVSWSKIRLTAQLKAAVEQFDTLVLSFEDAAKNIEASVWPEIAAKSELEALFGGIVDASRVPSELSPKDWSRLVDNIFQLVSRRSTEARSSSHGHQIGTSGSLLKTPR